LTEGEPRYRIMARRIARKNWSQRNPWYMRAYYKKNRSRIRQYEKERSRRIKQEVLSHYSGDREPFCQCCLEKRIEFLTMDHMDGHGHQHRKAIKSTNFFKWLKRNNYPTNYQVLCMNCNFAKGIFGICPHKKELEIIAN